VRAARGRSFGRSTCLKLIRSLTGVFREFLKCVASNFLPGMATVSWPACTRAVKITRIHSGSS